MPLLLLQLAPVLPSVPPAIHAIAVGAIFVEGRLLLGLLHGLLLRGAKAIRIAHVGKVPVAAPTLPPTPPPSGLSLVLLVAALAIVGGAFLLVKQRRTRRQLSAAIKLQSIGRGWRASWWYRLQRAAILRLQWASRGRAAVLARASAVIQAHTRRFFAQQSFRAVVSAALRIQTAARGWRAYSYAAAAIDARLIVRGELGRGLRRRRIAVERLDAASRKLDAATRADAAALLCRVWRGHLARQQIRANARHAKKRAASRRPGRRTIEGGRRAPLQPLPTNLSPRQLDFTAPARAVARTEPPAPPKPASALTSADEVSRRLEQLESQCADLLRLRAAPGGGLEISRDRPPPSTPPRRDRFSNVGAAAPPSPSGSEKRRSLLKGALMGELKGRLAVRRSRLGASPTLTPQWP